jgi:hypothetical protein
VLHRGMSASLIGRSGSSAFSAIPATGSMSLAGSCFFPDCCTIGTYQATKSEKIMCGRVRLSSDYAADIERRQADVGDFLLTKRDFETL